MSYRTLNVDNATIEQRRCIVNTHQLNLLNKAVNAYNKGEIEMMGVKAMARNTFPGDIAQAFSVIHRAFLRDTKQQYDQLGLNPTSAYILLYLAQHGPSTQSTLAHALIIDKGQITRETKKLASLGFLTKAVSPTNRTANIVTITATGKKLLPTIIAIRNHWWEERLAQNNLAPTAPFVTSIQKIQDELTQH
jgi:DNA-binding MarR family transcriptional regulator